MLAWLRNIKRRIGDRWTLFLMLYVANRLRNESEDARAELWKRLAEQHGKKP